MTDPFNLPASFKKVASLPGLDHGPFSVGVGKYDGRKTANLRKWWGIVATIRFFTNIQKKKSFFHIMLYRDVFVRVLLQGLTQLMSYTRLQFDEIYVNNEDEKYQNQQENFFFVLYTPVQTSNPWE